MNPTAMSKPVPKSNMLAGSGVADTDSVSVEGLLLPRTSETTNRSGWPFKFPVKTTSLSDGPVSASELIKMLISGVPDGGEVKATKSLPGMTAGGSNVTPGHENPTLTASLNVAGLPKSTEDEPPNVCVQTGEAKASKGATKAAGATKRSLLSMDLMFMVFTFSTLLLTYE
jgi:hypothetical protein